MAATDIFDCHPALTVAEPRHGLETHHPIALKGASR
jgi:hypothetical protein